MPTEKIVRNEQSKELAQFKILKGNKRKGTTYLAPKVDFSTPEAFDREIAWAGKDVVSSVLQTFYKRTYQDLWFGNVQEDGSGPGYDDKGRPNIHMAAFLEDAANFSAAGMKIGEIDEKLEEAQAQLLDMVGAIDAAPDADGKMVLEPDLFKKINETKEYIQLLKAQREKRSKKSADTEAAPAEPSVEVR